MLTASVCARERNILICATTRNLCVVMQQAEAFNPHYLSWRGAEHELFNRSLGNPACGKEILLKCGIMMRQTASFLIKRRGEGKEGKGREGKGEKGREGRREERKLLRC